MMMTVVVPRRANQCTHVKVSSVKPIASHKGQVCWFLNQICVVTMPEVCRWTVWTLSPCFLSYTQVYLFCQQKSAAWSTMSPFYNSGDVVLPCEIIVVKFPHLCGKRVCQGPFSLILLVMCHAKRKGNTRSELMASWFARMLWKILLDFLLEHHCSSFKKSISHWLITVMLTSLYISSMHF